MRTLSGLALLLAAGCQLPSVAERYAGDIARFEETGTLVDPPIEDDLTMAFAEAGDRVITMRRAALYEAPRPQVDPFDALPADLEVWRTSAVARASTDVLRRVKERSEERIDRLRGEFEALGIDPDADLDEEELGTVGKRYAARRDVLRLRDALTLEERKLAILDEELAARGE